MLRVVSRPATAGTLALFLALAAPAAAQTATFEDITVPTPPGYLNGNPAVQSGPFVSGGATFNNSFNATYGVWSGWSVSNVTDVTTPGHGNQYAAYNVAGGGVGAAGSANYGVANSYDPGDATIALPAGTAPVSIQITNTTYAALSMIQGDSFAKKFGGTSGDDPDFLKLTITGLDAQNAVRGTIDFYLADYRFTNNAQDYVVSQWTTIDLTPLGPDATKLSFGIDSSDVGIYGINTPTYFAADNLELMVVPVPEPAGLLAAGAVGVAWAVRRRGRSAG